MPMFLHNEPNLYNNQEKEKPITEKKNTEKLNTKLVAKDQVLVIENQSSMVIVKQSYWKNLIDRLKRNKKKIAELKDKIEKLEDEKIMLKQNYEVKIKELKDKSERADKFLSQQGKGRPRVLTAEQEEYIMQIVIGKLQNNEKISVKQIQYYITINMGYTGSYETLRAFVSVCVEYAKKEFKMS